MSNSAFCDLCSRDPDTGETFCVRLGEWVAKCPFREDGTPWDEEDIDTEDNTGKGEDNG